MRLKLVAGATLDYETASVIALQITANDGVADSDTITVYVDVEDANDAPMLTEAVATARGAVRENVAGADTGIALRLADVDNAGANDFTFTITSTDAVDQSALFRLSKRRGCGG